MDGIKRKTIAQGFIAERMGYELSQAENLISESECLPICYILQNEMTSEHYTISSN